MVEKNVLFVIAPNDFRDEELFHPKEEVEKAGIKTTVASLTTDEAKGMMGGTIKPDLTIDDVNMDDYDAVVFVGGLGSSVYFDNARAHEIAKSFFEKNKVTAAICIAPNTLAQAGVLEGKRVTSYPSVKGDIEAKSGEYTGSDVEADGNVITASGPPAAREFGKKIVEMLLG